MNLEFELEFEFERYDPVNTDKVMSNRSGTHLTFFVGQTLVL